MASSAILNLSVVKVDRPQIVIVGASYILKFCLDPNCSFGDTAICIFWRLGLKLPIRSHFWGCWGTFSQVTTLIVLTPKTPPCAEARRLSHKNPKSVEQLDQGAGSEKGKTGQSKTLEIGLYLLFWGRIFPWSWNEILLGGLAPVVIMCAKFQNNIFTGYDSTGGEFPRVLPYFLSSNNYVSSPK